MDPENQFQQAQMRSASLTQHMPACLVFAEKASLSQNFSTLVASWGLVHETLLSCMFP